MTLENILRRPHLKKIRVSTVLIYTVLIAIAVYTLFPLAFLFFNSFKGQADIVSSPLKIPEVWDVAYLENSMKAIHFFSSLGVTAGITAVSILVQVLASSLVAWMMVRNKSKWSFVLFMAFTAAMLIPFQSVMYPLISMFDAMKLKNIPGLIIMYGGFGLSISVFLYHGFMKSVPKSIEEAALIDGASVFQIYFYVVMPLLKSTTVTVIILNGMWIWNDYLLPFLVIGNEPVKTLTLELYYAKLTSGQYGNPWEMIFPAVLISIIPIILVFLLLQKYIMKGVTASAVKE
jgi:raffinose/stachyose/melibiose transport system permease protein